MTTTEAPDRAQLEAALDSPAVFAEVLLGSPLFEHQVEVVSSPARYRVICAGRQSGKSRTLAIEALHQAYTKPGSLTLLVSAGETASKRLLSDCAQMVAASPWLAGDVDDDTKSVLSLSNGSTIRSVPASQYQIRGWAVDLLIVDEAGFIDQEIWRAAEPSIIARPGSRVILTSSPWGGPDHFFKMLWLAGMQTPGPQVEAWHWPSIINPLVSQTTLDEIQGRENPVYFEREYLAHWMDETGQYFTSEELAAVTVGYTMVPPAEADCDLVVGGIDWGFAHDANTLVLLAALDDGGMNRNQFGNDPIFYVPWLEERFREPYAKFIHRIADIGDCSADTWNGRPGYWFKHLVSEANGVGSMPTQELRRVLRERQIQGTTYDVHTTARRKEAAFGTIKLLVQQGRLLLPRHPSLLKQLGSLTWEQMDSGMVRISVPDNVAHDDVAMGLAQAVSCLRMRDGRYVNLPYRAPLDDEPTNKVLEARCGTKIHTRPHALGNPLLFQRPRGGDNDTEW